MRILQETSGTDTLLRAVGLPASVEREDQFTHMVTLVRVSSVGGIRLPFVSRITFSALA